MNNDNPNIRMDHFEANGSSSANRVGIYFNGNDFFAYGIKAGADTVTKKLGSGTPTWVNLGQYSSKNNNTINVTSYDGYQNFTIDNFRIMPVSAKIEESTASYGNSSDSYDASTGVFTIGRKVARYTTNYSNEIRSYFVYNVYLLQLQ